MKNNSTFIHFETLILYLVTANAKISNIPEKANDK